MLSSKSDVEALVLGGRIACRASIRACAAR